MRKSTSPGPVTVSLAAMVSVASELLPSVAFGLTDRIVSLNASAPSGRSSARIWIGIVRSDEDPAMLLVSV